MAIFIKAKNDILNGSDLLLSRAAKYFLGQDVFDCGRSRVKKQKPPHGDGNSS